MPTLLLTTCTHCSHDRVRSYLSFYTRAVYRIYCSTSFYVTFPSKRCQYEHSVKCSQVFLNAEENDATHFGNNCPRVHRHFRGKRGISNQSGKVFFFLRYYFWSIRFIIHLYFTERYTSRFSVDHRQFSHRHILHFISGRLHFTLKLQLQ